MADVDRIAWLDLAEGLLTFAQNHWSRHKCLPV